MWVLSPTGFLRANLHLPQFPKKGMQFRVCSIPASVLLNSASSQPASYEEVWLRGSPSYGCSDPHYCRHTRLSPHPHPRPDSSARVQSWITPALHTVPLLGNLWRHTISLGEALGEAFSKLHCNLRSFLPNSSPSSPHGFEK